MKQTTWNLHGQVYSTGLRWVDLGVALGRLGVTLRSLGVSLVPQRSLGTNMLVSPTQNSHIGGLRQRECFRVAVEYRLKTFCILIVQSAFSCIKFAYCCDIDQNSFIACHCDNVSRDLVLF